MREVGYEDDDGRLWIVALPDGVPDEEVAKGVHVGPAPVDALGLPHDTAVRLHNQLAARRIFTYQDAVTRRAEVFAALQAAFGVDTENVVQLYNSDSANSMPPAKATGQMKEHEERSVRRRRR